METDDPKWESTALHAVSRILLIATISAHAGVFFGCRRAESNNASNKPINSVDRGNEQREPLISSSVNTMANTGNYAANTASNAANSNVAPPYITVNAAVLREALKERLQHDNGGLLSEKDWTKDAWLDATVGVFYENDDEIAKTIVCDVTEKALLRGNKKMQGWARQRLFDTVASATKCRSAINSMVKATLSAVSINPVP